MRISEKWLRELADPGVDTTELARRLTMAGLKVDGVAAAAPPLHGIVSGTVVTCAPHPDADTLSVCGVDVGDGETHRIVCGAHNVRVGMSAPVALPGVTLPGGMTIAVVELRGIESAGMLCSGSELQLSDDHRGLFVLPDDTPPGTPLADVLGLDDAVFELDLTPNRGDCMSVLGVAREVAAIYGLEAPAVDVKPVRKAIDDTLKVTVEDDDDCRVYCGRVIRGVDAMRASPLWLQEKLRRAGVRPAGAAVDVTAYVMLELGQPLHAFDRARIRRAIRVRRGHPGERLELLDGQTALIDEDVLVIADSGGPLALAGVMGGAASAVTADTRDVFLESAHFDPLAVSGRARRFNVASDAAQRFERGVDPALARRALERATRLLVAIAGGKPGPVTSAGRPAPPLRGGAIRLRHERIGALLGIMPDRRTVTRLLTRLQFATKATRDGWQVRVPSWRFDIGMEADLVEEVARLYGYERIPSRDAPAPMAPQPTPDGRVPDQRLCETLIQRGYQQVITYSFVDAGLQRRLGLGDGALDLANPISAEMGQMRTSLWPGLLGCLMHNAKRQQGRVRIFETGLRFIEQDNDLTQEKMISGLIWGGRYPEQWGLAAEPVDFHDLKGDCEALLGTLDARFEAARHPALHPGQSAQVMIDGRAVGWLGTLHPQHAAALDLGRPPILFELEHAAITLRPVPVARPVSRFPGLRRDLALVVPEAVTAGQLLAEVDRAAPPWLEKRFIFDIYRGRGIEPGLKSVALGLILQETSRTLTDSEADAFVERLVAHLGEQLRAMLRD